MNKWPSIIESLREHMTISEIAEAVGTRPSTISELESGRTRQPLHDTGQKLIQLRETSRGRQRLRAA